MAERSGRPKFRWEVLIPALLILWRVAAGSPAHFWKDWILIGSIFWIYTIFKSASASWPVVTVTTMAYLLGIYLLGQLPHALAILGIGV